MNKPMTRQERIAHVNHIRQRVALLLIHSEGATELDELRELSECADKLYSKLVEG